MRSRFVVVGLDCSRIEERSGLSYSVFSAETVTAMLLYKFVPVLPPTFSLVKMCETSEVGSSWWSLMPN